MTTLEKLKFILLLSSFLPVFASALVSGGGYQIYEQVTAIIDTSTGGGYSLKHSGNTIQGNSTGNGFSVLNGGNPSFVSLTPVVTPTPAPGGGGGGGGGGGLVIIPAATPTSIINNKYLNQIGDQNQPTDFSNDFRADINDSGKVDVIDFNILLINWEKRLNLDLTKIKKDRCPQANIADINCDGKNNVLDFNLILVYWGQYIGTEGELLKGKNK